MAAPVEVRVLARFHSSQAFPGARGWDAVHVTIAASSLAPQGLRRRKLADVLRANLLDADQLATEAHSGSSIPKAVCLMANEEGGNLRVSPGAYTTVRIYADSAESTDTVWVVYLEPLLKVCPEWARGTPEDQLRFSSYTKNNKEGKKSTPMVAFVFGYLDLAASNPEVGFSGDVLSYDASVRARCDYRKFFLHQFSPKCMPGIFSASSVSASHPPASVDRCDAEISDSPKRRRGAFVEQSEEMEDISEAPSDRAERREGDGDATSPLERGRNSPETIIRTEIQSQSFVASPFIPGDDTKVLDDDVFITARILDEICQRRTRTMVLGRPAERVDFFGGSTNAAEVDRREYRRRWKVDQLASSMLRLGAALKDHSDEVDEDRPSEVAICLARAESIHAARCLVRALDGLELRKHDILWTASGFGSTLSSARGRKDHKVGGEGEDKERDEKSLLELNYRWEESDANSACDDGSPHMRWSDHIGPMENYYEELPRPRCCVIQSLSPSTGSGGCTCQQKVYGASLRVFRWVLQEIMRSRSFFVGEVPRITETLRESIRLRVVPHLEIFRSTTNVP